MTASGVALPAGNGGKPAGADRRLVPVAVRAAGAARDAPQAALERMGPTPAERRLRRGIASETHAGIASPSLKKLLNGLSVSAYREVVIE